MKNKNFSVLQIILFVFLCTILLTSCAESQHHLKTCLEGHQYGFFGGLWHGIIAPFSFIASLFNSDVAVWAVNNNGGWYAFGFVLGVGGFSGIIYTKEK
jgi:hypothetical protein